MKSRGRRLQTFAATALAGLILMGAALGLLMRDLASSELEELGIDQHESVARSLSAALGDQITPLLAAARDPAVRGTLANSPEVDRLRRSLVDPLRGMRIARIKIYAPDGLTVFSSERAQVGTVSEDNHGIRDAMTGRTVSELIHHDSFNRSDGVVENRDLLETYVPIRINGSGRILGVFELYTDMTSLLARIARTRRTVVLTTTLVMGSVLLGLLLLFRRSELSLRAEERVAEGYLQELKAAHDDLEVRVEQRTRELAASEQRFQDVADAAGEYIWEIDVEGHFTFLTDRVSSVLGYPKEALIGRTPMEFTPPEDVDRVRAFFRERDSDQPFVGLEHRSVTPSGERIWLSVSGVPMFDADGTFKGYRGACTDITARKMATQALEKMSLATEQSSEVVIITDTQGVIEYVNPAFRRVSGYEPDEAIGRTPAFLRAPDQREEVYGELWDTILSGEPWRGVLCNRRKNGAIFWNFVSIFPLRDAAGSITHFVGLQTDITQRQLDLAALEASEARLRAVMDSVTDAIITSDEKGLIESVNPAACAMFGYTAEELIGRNVRVLTPQPYRSQHDRYMQRYLDTGEGRIIGVGGRDVEGLHRDGSIIPLELGVGAMSVGERRGFVAVLRDLSERRRAERQLEATRQSYFHREKMAAIGQLAAGIVHEVGNPVAAILGATRHLRNELGDGEAQAPEALDTNLELIEQQADRLALMTREISDYARPRPVEKTVLDLNEVVRSTLKLLRYDARLQSLDLRIDLDTSIPALRASADQLTQVLLNLVLNAADAGRDVPAGEGFIEIATHPGRHCVTLSVRDNGTGMDPETLGRATSAYFSTKHPESGMGLGLALCEDIVNDHGGRLHIESVAGQGTTVLVELPFDEQYLEEH
jgi:two-component system sensor kinase FixL